jgi:alpha-tubulin suppressor-like RCC1 family protein
VSVLNINTLASSIGAGGTHYCVLTGGGVNCWGNNGDGQLGRGNSGTYIVTPYSTTIPQLSSGVTAVSSGGSTNCALTSVGGVKCWGKNDKGQVGE